MARLPDSTDLGGLPSARSGRPIARYDTSAEWQGLADLGQGAARLGGTMQAAWDRVSASQTETRVEEFEFAELQNYDRTIQTLQPGQAKGFTENYLKGYFDRAKKFQESVDPQFRPATDTKLFGLEQRIYGDATGFERGELRRTALNDLDHRMRNVVLPFAGQAARLPTGDLRKGKLLQEALAKGRKALEETFGLSPLEAEKAWVGSTDERGNWRPGIEENIQKAFLDELPDEEKLFVDPTRPVETLGDRTRGIESGGADPDVIYSEKKESSAMGRDGFLRGTWEGMIKKYRPELAQGKSSKQIWDLRRDDDLSAEMRDLYAEENAQFLGARGHGATPGNIYLAHFLGPGGAVQMLGADPNMPADQVNPKAAAANQNVFYDNGRPRTAGEIVQWSAALMSGVRHEDWATVLDAVPYEYKTRSVQDASARLVKAEADRLQQEKAAHDAWLNNFENGILDGRAGLADIQGAYDNGILTDATVRARLIEMVQKRDADGVNYNAAVQAITDPNFRFNAFSDDHRKMVNLAYDKGPMQGGAGLLSDDEQSVQDLRALIARTGIVPSSAKDVLQSGIWSAAGQERDTAFSILDGLYRENPALVSRAFSEADIKRLQDYQQLAPLLPPEELEQRLNPNMNPQEAERRKTLRVEGEKLARDIKTPDLLSAFDPSWMPFDQPEAPRDPLMVAALRADFENLYAERYSVTGQEDAAKTQAIERMRDKWGPTTVGSENLLMAYPPELQYPMVDGAHDWMDDQLDDFIFENEPDAQEWFPIVTEETERVVSGNRANGVSEPVPYAIGIIDKNGAFRILTKPGTAVPTHVIFNYDEARQGALQRFEEERQLSLPVPEPELTPEPTPEGYVRPFTPEPGPGPTLQ